MLIGVSPISPLRLYVPLWEYVPHSESVMQTPSYGLLSRLACGNWDPPLWEWPLLEDSDRHFAVEVSFQSKRIQSVDGL